ncbi:amino acid permease [Flammeovirgaceae bacterium SG7u.111]|nr:amino acid permease [Flammeovirgaceae bacterium SG7u.132]WPO37816.1 amino acid permease [Flammeovirgaceae bacterium SG7u.111]
MAGKIEEIYKKKIIPVTFERHISLFGATTIGVGALMGAGVYVLIGLAADKAGPSVWLSYVICGGLAFLTTLVYAELSKTLPVSGGGYAYVYKTLGSFGGFATGWYLALGSIFACGLYAIGFAQYFTTSLGFELSDFQVRLISAGIVLLLTLLNAKGTNGADKIQGVLTWGNLAILLVLILFSLPLLDIENVKPMFPKGYGGTFSAISIIYISFFGYQLIANSSDEIRTPKQVVPLAMKYSMEVSFAGYLAVAVISIMVIPWEQLAASNAPLVLVASESLGKYGWVLISAGGILASLSALNSTLVSQARQIFAMGKDGFVPKLLGQLHEKNKTPQTAILAGGALVMAALLFFDLEFIVKSANFALLASLLPVSLSLRKIYRKQPKNIKIAWWKKMLPAATLIANLGLLSSLDWMSILFGLQLGLAGFAVYWFYSKKNENRSKSGINLVLSETKQPMLGFHSKILVPMANPLTQKGILTVSNILLKKSKGEIVALSVVNTPEQVDFQAALSDAGSSLELLKRTEEMQMQVDFPIRPVLRASRSISQGIIHTAEEERCNLIVMGYTPKPEKPQKKSTTTLMEQVVSGASNDILLFNFKGLKEGNFAPKKIAVSVGGKGNLELMLKLAGALADKFGGEITFINILPKDFKPIHRLHADKMMIKVLQENNSKSLYQVRLLTSDSPVQALIDVSSEFDLLVIGTAKVGILSKAMVGNFSTQVAEGADCSVAIVRVASTTKKIIKKIR